MSTDCSNEGADPLATNRSIWLRQLGKLGLTATSDGHIVEKNSAAAKEDRAANGEPSEDSW